MARRRARCSERLLRWLLLPLLRREAATPVASSVARGHAHTRWGTHGEVLPSAEAGGGLGELDGGGDPDHDRHRAPEVAQEDEQRVLRGVGGARGGVVEVALAQVSAKRVRVSEVPARRRLPVEDAARMEDGVAGGGARGAAPRASGAASGQQRCARERRSRIAPLTRFFSGSSFGPHSARRCLTTSDERPVFRFVVEEKERCAWRRGVRGGREAWWAAWSAR